MFDSAQVSSPEPLPAPPKEMPSPKDTLLEDELSQASELAEKEIGRLITETANLSTPSILVVDDEDVVARTVAQQLSRRGYNAFFVTNPEQVWDFCSTIVPHAIITDVRMPGISGIDLATQILKRYPDMVIIVTSGFPSVEMTVEALRAGATDFLVKPVDIEVLQESLTRGFERRRARIRQLRYQVNLEQMILERTRRLIESSNALSQRTREIGLAYRDLVVRLGRASQWRDDETGQHIRRIGLFSAEIARQLGLSESDVELVGEASPMHDIGKIGVPDSILLKPGRLTPVEFDCMKTHTLIGAELLSGSEVPILKMSENIALSHHEWFNGGGYPYGLSANEIPLCGKIVALADVYDALMHDRSYKKAYLLDETISTMNARRGTQFDPEVFDAFLAVVERFHPMEESLRDSPLIPSKYNVEIGLFKLRTPLPIGDNQQHQLADDLSQ